MARKRKPRPGRSTLSLLPARILLATNGVIPDEPPPADVPVQGVPLEIFKELSRKGRSAPGVEVLIDPIFEADKWIEIRLLVNGVQSGVPQNELGRTIIFKVFQTEFRDNITNVIKYVLKNVAGNESESTELWALYSANRPGGNGIPGTGPHPGLIISLPEELGDPLLIDKESANAGVYATHTYSHMKAHDKITVEMGNERFDFKVKPNEVGQSVKTLIERHMFDLVGSQKNCSFRYTVTDQLLNTTDARRWSNYIYANIDLERVALTKPVLRENRSDAGDDPKTVDLTKLAGGPLLVIIVPKEAIYQKDDCVRVIFRSSHMDREFEYFDTITVDDDLGLLQPCVVEVPNNNIVLDSNLTVTFELHRPKGTVIGFSRSATAKVIGVAVPDLQAPSIKEADGNSLDPLKAKDTLTALIPAYNNMIGTQLSVTWTGTPGGGSHTTTPIAVTTQGDQQVPLPKSVVALNLNKPVTVTYTVIRNNSPKDSEPLILAVQPIANEDPALGRPLIVEAANSGEGPEFDVSQMTKDATIRVNSWPLIALKQYVWLRLRGTNSDNTPYTQTFWQPPNGQTNQTWINQGYYTQAIPLATLKNLKDGSELVVEFKAGLGGSQVEAEAVTLQGRRYTVKALVELKPVITLVRGSPSGDDILEGETTTETAVTFGGTASQNQQIQLYDGLIAVGIAVDVDDRGNWTYTVTGLGATEHSFTAKALYGSGLVSAGRTFTVTAVVAPTITSVKGSPSGLEIPHGTETLDNTVTLTGSASLGQRVEIFDGTTSLDQAKADRTSGRWTLDISGLSPTPHSITAKALYGAGVVSAARNFTVIAAGGGYEDWEAENPQRFYDNVPVKFKSGLEVTQLRHGNFGASIEKGNPILGTYLALSLGNVMKLRWIGAVTTVSFRLAYVNWPGDTIRFFDLSGQLVQEVPMPITGDGYGDFTFQAPAGRNFNYFELHDVEEFGFGVDNIHWFSR